MCPQSRALPRLALTAVPRATLCRGLSTKVEPDPWILEEYEATDVTPPELFGYCALHPPPASTAMVCSVAFVAVPHHPLAAAFACARC